MSLLTPAVKAFYDVLRKKKNKTVVEKQKVSLIKESIKLDLKLTKASLTIPKLTLLIEDKKLEIFNKELEVEREIDREVEKLKFRDRLSLLLVNKVEFKKKSIRDRYVTNSKVGFNGFVTETTINQTRGLPSKTATQYVDRIARGRDTLYTTIRARVNALGGLKCILKFEVRFTRKTKIEVEENGVIIIKSVDEYTDDNGRDNPWFYSNLAIILKGETKEEINNSISEMAIRCQFQIEEFTNNGSDWVLDKIVTMAIVTNGYQPGRGGSWLPLPECYSSRSCVNVKNFNSKTEEQYNDCFEISILAHLYPAKRDHYLYSHYRKYKGTLNMEGLTIPVKIEKRSLLKFENNNNLQINIFEAKTRTNKKGKEVVDPLPLYISTLELPKDRQVDLLYIVDEDERNDGESEISNAHFALCRNFNSMMSTFNEHKGALYFCKRCLTHFDQQGLLDQHMANRVCLDFEGIKTILPKKGDNICQFTNYKRQQQNPFRIYADFECNIEPVIDLNSNGKTRKNGVHKNISFGVLLKCSVDEYTLPYESRRRSQNDTDSEWYKVFLDKLDQYGDYVYDLLKKNEKMIITKKQEVDFLCATNCSICGKLFKDPSKKVRDHDHLTGLYRGAAHNGCNLNYNHKNFKIPVVFHNLKGYDSHFIIQAIVHEAKNRKMSVIAQNSEKFVCMTIGRFRFIDSLAFLNSSLDKLVESLGTDLVNFKNMSNNYNDLSAEKRRLLIRKGVYPYEYMDSLTRFEEKCLPPIESFFSSLTQKSIKDEDYKFANDIWTTFNLKNLGDYHDLYLKNDVLLLADVFENFISLCMREYKLDPTHYVSLPSFSLDAGLKFTGVKLELYHEGQEDMYSLIEKGIRGGISVISKRYAEANNKYMKDYDEKVESSYIMYLDANNLYGYAMKGSLPTGDHRWEAPEDWTESKILSMKEDGATGAIFEVDIEYPKELHDSHSDYPFLVEKSTTQYNSLSQTQKSMVSENNFFLSEKLVPNLNDKTKYIVHYRTLKQALQNGLILKKIHRVLAFKQSRWLEHYIDHNTDLRAKSKTAFEKDFFKLLNNAFYGKCLENVRGRIDYKICLKESLARKYIRRPTFKRSDIIGEEVVGIEMRKQIVKLDKPIFCGFSILEISKELMYDFHYNRMKKKYNENASLLMTDTDSLVYHVKTEDIYKDMKENINAYDTSDYPKDHFLYSKENEKVVGKFKDEAGSMIIKSFVGLRSKMYSYEMTAPEMDLDKSGNIQKHQKAKGIPKSIVSKSIDHKLYTRCLLEADFKHTVTFSSLRSKNHHMYSMTQEKTGLSAFDDKRFILPDGVQTRPHGHWRNKE